MKKENQNVPQEFQNEVGKKSSGRMDNEKLVNVNEDDIQTGNSIIIGGGDPNLSPDAGKPLI